jgi:hypothetical protein
MTEVNLTQITEGNLLAHWRIVSRYPSQGINAVFKESTSVNLSQGEYCSGDGLEAKGQWMLIKDDTIIFHPQIKFFRDKKVVGHAIITRLYSFPRKDTRQHRLTLYFSTGQEVLLEYEE